MNVMRRNAILPVVLCLCLLTGCAASLKPVQHGDSSGVKPVADSFLQQQREKHLSPDNGHSGFALLDSGREAFLMRAALIEVANQSIDAQYYIWNDDKTGRYLANRLMAAADRGVQVRLLLDDINLAGNEALFARLDSHPNMSVRIFNPVRARNGATRLFSLIGNFDRVNRRMHNKSFVVDGQAGIAGGRNVGDEYFDEDPRQNTRDRDVLMLGPLVEALGDSFEAYWQNPWAYPLHRLYEQGADQTADRLPERVAGGSAEGAELQARPPANPDTARAYLNQQLVRLVQAPAELVFDPPPENLEDSGKLSSDTPKATARALYRLAQAAEQEILIESAYLILTEDQLNGTSGLANPDVSVTAFTNSLATNDLITNHSGYARWRKSMLEHGIELYELRPDSPACRRWVTDDLACGPGGLSLHSKAVVFDRETLFIGSFNVNLRSIYLNGETVLIIHSPELARRVADDIDYAIRPENSWRVSLDEQGNLRWQAGERTVRHEPDVGFWRRFQSGFLSWLPIAKYL